MIAERKPPTFWPQNPDDDMQMIGALRLSRKGEYRAERAGRAPFGDHPSICRRAALSSRNDALSQMSGERVTAVAKPGSHRRHRRRNAYIDGFSARSLRLRACYVGARSSPRNQAKVFAHFIGSIASSRSWSMRSQAGHSKV